MKNNMGNCFPYGKISDQSNKRIIIIDPKKEYEEIINNNKINPIAISEKFDKNVLLYERAKIEYENYLEEIKSRTPEQIIDAAYEIATKADILILLENTEFDTKEYDILLNLEKPLTSIYDEWLSKDYSVMEYLHDTIDEIIIKEKVTNRNIAIPLPDSTISISDMEQYGYNYDGMLPLNKDKALELFDKGQAVFLLYGDNTEGQALDRDEIVQADERYGSLFGIEVNDYINFYNENQLETEEEAEF